MPPKCMKQVALLVDEEEKRLTCAKEAGHKGNCKCSMKKLDNSIQKISVLQDRLEIEWR